MNAETIASLTTAAGTLVLAVATFASVRSANRASRLAERSLLANVRPMLVHARLDDSAQKVGFADNHWVRLEGNHAAAHEVDGVVYLAMPVRNAGPGTAVIQSWSLVPFAGAEARPDPAELTEFRQHSRDMLVPPFDIGFWQAAVRDPDDPDREPLRKAIAERQRLLIDVLYSDLYGGQRAISRFGLLPVGESEWLSSMSRNFVLDGPSAR